jgi:hypothetical protein
MPKADDNALTRQNTLNLQLVTDENSVNDLNDDIDENNFTDTIEIEQRFNVYFYRNICIILGISTMVTISNILITNYIVNNNTDDNFGSCSC